MQAPWSVGDVVAVLALILSLISLAWQVLSRLLDGPRVKVDVGTYIPVGGASSYQAGRSITVRNVGRTVAVVSHLSIDMGHRDGKHAPLGPIAGGPIGPPVPYRLEPSDAVDWKVPFSPLEEMAGRYPNKNRWRARVSLASGKVLHSRRGRF